VRQAGNELERLTGKIGSAAKIGLAPEEEWVTARITSSHRSDMTAAG
jgi:hypothetical protein